ncbi:MAG: HipA N-terminal domain-containing protein [Sphaerochaeta sp.]|nr:HipA N-terminal domain-containing protein [Sphaerochaeta sp.]
MKEGKRKAKIMVDEERAGILEETEQGYTFTYDRDYLAKPNAQSISLTMPLREKAYHSTTFFPFFDGLIPEGWLLSLTMKNWKLDARDRMGLLLVACRDCIGAVSVEALQ